MHHHIAQRAPRSVFFPHFAALLACAFLSAGCQRQDAAPPSGSATTPPQEAATTTPAAVPTATVAPVAAAKPVVIPANPPPKEIWKEFSGEKALEEAKKQVEVGPRPSGSPEDEKARGLIIQALEASGWEAQRQEFTDDTPRGPIQFVNIIGRFASNGARPAPTNTQRAIVCSHYDTKRFSTIRFVGASDGASSTGALLELARILALDPALAAKVELVFFDGEEAIQQFTETDGLWGSRHYASDLRATGRAHQFKFAILWDMISDKDLHITLSPNSPPELTKGIFSAAEALGARQNFGYFNRDILDDHVPLGRAGIASIDLIDFDYLWWHTADDTLDKLGPESLRKVGAVTLYYLKQALP